MQCMKARPLVKTKEVRDDGSIIEIVIWSVPQPVWGYDNEYGKGDHRHFDGTESAYRFSTLEQLLDDFEKDVAAVKRDKS